MGTKRQADPVLYLRVVTGLSALVALYLILSLSLNDWFFFLTIDSAGFLFVAGGLSLVLIVFLTAPHHSRPVDITSGSLLLLFALFSYDTALPPAIRFSLATYVAIIGLSALTLSLRRGVNDGGWPRTAYRLLQLSGRPAVMYGATIASVAIASLPPEGVALWLILLWSAFVSASRNLMRAIEPFLKWRGWRREVRVVLGSIDYQLGESMFAVTLGARTALPRYAGLELADGSLAVAQLARSYSGPAGQVIWLVPQRSHHGYLVLRKGDDTISAMKGQLDVRGDCVELPAKWFEEDLVRTLQGHNYVEDIVGQVAKGTDSTHVLVNVIGSRFDWSEGDVMSCAIQGKSCLLQIVSVEVDIAPDEHGYRDALQQATCVRIGEFDEQDGTFQPVDWVPEVGTPVSRVDVSPHRPEHAGFSIGTLQGLDTGVPVRDVASLVTHNSMVLGALGTGKSTVARRIIEHLANTDVRIVVIDVTREHLPLLKAAIGDDIVEDGNPGIEVDLDKSIDHVHTTGSGSDTTYYVDGTGNVDQFRKNSRKTICDFLFSSGQPKNPAAPVIDGTARVLVINPDLLEVTHGEKMGFKVVPRGLSAAQKSRIIAEELLSVLMKVGLADPGIARVLMVLEEAHLLIPEFSFAAHEGDSEAANGTARVVLQGRKYGLGALVVAQRTANVSKSVLTQCMSTVALRTMDETGQSFLANQLGIEAASSLSQLPDHVAWIAGAGFQLRAPLRVRLPGPANQ